MPPSTWAQIYDPLGAWPLSTAIAALPVVTLFCAGGPTPQQVGKEAAIFKPVFPHSIALASLVGVVVLVYAYLWPGVVPGP